MHPPATDRVYAAYGGIFVPHWRGYGWSTGQADAHTSEHVMSADRGETYDATWPYSAHTQSSCSRPRIDMVKPHQRGNDACGQVQRVVRVDSPADDVCGEMSIGTPMQPPYPPPVSSPSNSVA